MLITLLAAGAALAVGGAVGAWQYGLSRNRREGERPNDPRGPYRHGQEPGASVDPTTGGYPMPPSFDDDGWTPKR